MLMTKSRSKVYSKEEWAALGNTWWAKEAHKGCALIMGRWIDDLILENFFRSKK